MELLEDCAYVVACYNLITSISRRDAIRVGGKKDGEYSIHYLPTLEKLEMWMDLNDWDSAGMDRFEFFHLITVYHNAYTKYRLET